jgi:starch synthase
MTTTALISTPPVPSRRAVSESVDRRSLTTFHSRAQVVHLSAEYGVLARTGGLAEAVAGLARAQARAGSPRAAVILPLYPALRRSGRFVPLAAAGRGAPGAVAVWRDSGLAEPGQPDVLALDLPGFDRPGIYGEGGVDYPDNPARFSAFVRAALEALPWLTPAVRVLHVHDWHAGLAPVLLRTEWAGRRFYDAIATVLTVHNGAYQGRFPREVFDGLGLPSAVVDALAPDREGRLAWLDLGLRFADLVTTVSPNHAEELRTPLGGFGLDDRYRALGDRLVGIRNGIDAIRWDPATDGALPASFQAESPAGRAASRTAVDQALGFSSDGAPLVGLVARLVEQKGIDLVAEGRLVEWFPEARFVVMGDGSPDYRDRLRRLEARFPDRVRAPLHFDEGFERLLLAGADVVLVPSLYEPCGLVQLHAQRYGAVPVVRRVGGLADTVVDGVTGFVFDEYSVPALAEALGRALAAWRNPIVWPALVERVMRLNVGWEDAVPRFRDIYRAASTRHAAWEVQGHRGH